MAETETLTGEQIRYAVKREECVILTLATVHYEAALAHALLLTDSLPSIDSPQHDIYNLTRAYAYTLGYVNGKMAGLGNTPITDGSVINDISILTAKPLSRRYPDIEPERIDAVAFSLMVTTGILDSAKDGFELGLNLGKLLSSGIEAEYPASTDTPET